MYRTLTISQFQNLQQASHTTESTKHGTFLTQDLAVGCNEKIGDYHTN